MLNRRAFLALAGGLVVAAREPVRAYSFVGGWARPRLYPLRFKGYPVFRDAEPVMGMGFGSFDLMAWPPNHVDGWRLGTYAELEPIVRRLRL